MFHGITICAECNNTITTGDIIYMACDAAFCSEDCSVERINFIKIIDPQLKSPTCWKNPRDLEENDDKIPDSPDSVIHFPLKKLFHTFNYIKMIYHHIQYKNLQ